MLAGVRRLVAAPHLETDLQRLLEAFESLRERRDGDAERARFVLVPGGADPQDRATAGEHVERRDHLREHAGVAIHRSGHHGEDLRPRRVRRDETERGVSLEHLPLGWAEATNLEEV